MASPFGFVGETLQNALKTGQIQPSSVASVTAPAAPKGAYSAAFDPALRAQTQAGYLTTQGTQPKATMPTQAAPQVGTIDRSGLQGPTAPGAAFGGPAPAFQDPGNNLVNPGYTEQAFNLLQNRFMEDPSAGLLQG